MTFELAIQQLGGFAIVNDGPIGSREPLKDVARNLDRWVTGIVARTFLQRTVDDLARYANVPVINALSDLWHPCQALADMQTLRERFGSVRGLKLAFVGDGNNVAHSLMLNAARLGMDLRAGQSGEVRSRTRLSSREAQGHRRHHRRAHRDHATIPPPP